MSIGCRYPKKNNALEYISRALFLNLLSFHTTFSRNKRKIVLENSVIMNHIRNSCIVCVFIQVNTIFIESSVFIFMALLKNNVDI